jgi:hypothetical protein
MDIELPNGVVIQDIPEGTSKNEVMAKAIKARRNEITETKNARAAEKAAAK